MCFFYRAVCWSDQVCTIHDDGASGTRWFIPDRARGNPTSGGELILDVRWSRKSSWGPSGVEFCNQLDTTLRRRQIICTTESNLSLILSTLLFALSTPRFTFATLRLNWLTPSFICLASLNYWYPIPFHLSPVTGSTPSSVSSVRSFNSFLCRKCYEPRHPTPKLSLLAQVSCAQLTVISSNNMQKQTGTNTLNKSQRGKYSRSCRFRGRRRETPSSANRNTEEYMALHNPASRQKN